MGYLSSAAFATQRRPELPDDVRTKFMLLTDLVAPSAIIPALKVNSKKQLLQELAA